VGSAQQLVDIEGGQRVDKLARPPSIKKTSNPEERKTRVRGGVPVRETEGSVYGETVVGKRFGWLASTLSFKNS